MSNLRRLCALGAVTAVTLAGLTSASAPAQAAGNDPAGLDRRRLARGQLTGGLLHNDQYDFDDYGLSIDAGLSLAAVGGYDAAVAEISDAVAADIGSYIAYPGHTLAGSIAKAAWFASAAGDDPTAYGGEDLITDLEALVAGSDPIKGRIQDSYTPGPFESDFANVIGQAFAARSLAEESSAKAADVIGFLLNQQCPEGFFRLYFNPDATASDQTCAGGAGGESAPDTDATALAVLQLSGIAEADPAVVDPTTLTAVTDAIAAAETWLLGAQHADGSFGGGASTEAPNTNSTGAAGVGARRARRHRGGVEGSSVGPCAPGGRAGRLRRRPLLADRRDRVRRRGGRGRSERRDHHGHPGPVAPIDCADAAGAPVGAALGLGAARDRTDRLRPLRQQHDVPGQRRRTRHGPVRQRDRHAEAAGGLGLRHGLDLGADAATGTATAILTASVRAGSSASLRVDVLGAWTLKVKLRHHVVHRRAHVRVVVRRLAPGEQVTLRFRGHTVATGHASPSGRFVGHVKVRHKLGRAKIVARGEFPAIRRGKAVVRVVR